MANLKEVELASTGVYLPGDPVPFEQIEEYIGSLDQTSPRIQKMTKKLRPVVKDLIGIEQCHFAVDPETKELTESHRSMAVKAINLALEKAALSTKDIDAIFFGIAVPEHQVPALSTFIQEDLGIERCAEFEIHSNCTGMTKNLQLALDSLRTGRYKNIVVAYAQLSSPYLLSKNYNQSQVKTENILLRWFLSDSATAVVLKGKDKVESGIKLEEVYNESLGGKLPPAMWLNFGTSQFNLHQAYEAGLHHLGQDYSTVVDTGEIYFVEALKTMIERYQLNPQEIDYILATIPSTKLLNKGKIAFQRDFGIPHEKWFSNVHQKGYSGASSIIIGLDEMLDNNTVKPGQRVVCVTIESSKWMVGGFIADRIV